MTNCVCFHASNCGPEIHTGTPFTDVEDSKQNVAVTDEELAVRVTHRRRPVAASAGLVEHQRTVPVLQSPQQIGSGLGDQRASGCSLAQFSLPIRRT